jgi:light-regulated signal transduction histidine kinase (bacteriophytochrome)
VEITPLLGTRAVEWQVSDLPIAMCDPGLMKQVFADLLGNAVKYARKRDCALIHVSHTVGGGEEIFFVHDNDMGFDMEHAGKLFVFYRWRSEAEFEGNGFGLATVHRIIVKHGGRVWAEAKAGKGATLSFTIESQADRRRSISAGEVTSWGAN